MKIIDGRSLNCKVQQHNRNLAIKLRKENMTYPKIAQIIGVNKSTIQKWCKKYKEEGLKGLILKKRGVKLGTNCKLNQIQIKELQEILINKTPDTLKLNFSLWTRQAIQNLVLNLWSIFMPLRTITDYMKRLGFTPQKPIKRAYEQNPKIIRKWLEKEYPEISKKAKFEQAEIHWVDETGLNSNSNYLRGYSPIGKTPVICMKAKRFSINVISSVTNRGKLRFMTYEKALTTKIFIKFINRLCVDLNRKVFVILDNLAVHHSKKFMAWLEKRKDRIEAFYLPSYSPELNPDERLNRDLKTHFHSGPLVKNKKDFKKKTVSYLKSIQRMPYRIENYFKSKPVHYAA